MKIIILIATLIGSSAFGQTKHWIHNSQTNGGLVRIEIMLNPVFWTNTFITFTNHYGDVTSHAEIIKVTVNKLTYRTPNGGGTIKISELPGDLQKKFYFNPTNAADMDELESLTKQQDELKNQVITFAQSKYNRLKAQLVQGSRRVDGKVLQKISEGLLVQSGELSRKMQEYHEDVYGSRPGIIIEGNRPGAEALNLVLLQDYPDPNMADEGHVDVIAYPVGLFSYDSVGKSQKTVRKFSCDIDAAIRKLAADGN